MIADSEQQFATPPELQPVLKELSDREPIFHRPEFGTTRADFERMMVEDFWEVGASGARYSRQFALEELDRRQAAPREDVWETSDFCCRQVAPDVYLLTYTLLQQRVRRTRRCTIWKRTDQGWRIVYHQGTIVHGE
jgi:hypothetical protein